MDPIDSPFFVGTDDLGVDLFPGDDAEDPIAEADASPTWLSLHETVGFHPVSYVQGLRVIGIGSDSDSEEEEDQVVAVLDLNQIEDDRSPPQQLECVGIVDEQRVEVAEEEAVRIDGCLNDRNEDGSVLGLWYSEEEEEEWSDLEYDDALVTLIRVVLGRGEWNVADSDAGSYLDDDPVEDLEYESVFGQFVDHDRIGTTPTAKSVVERLPVVLITDEDAAEKNTFCAVCKDEILLAEMARQLPCLHIYHGGCILPWLAMSNTCPVCRYELPTKDPK
ncbi:E3 ubiquitin-protein ligase [Canna indica]|uniref:RING-type E3 ubiquitin transferase n=1 Tax=Canna indica TaxID=4628 RepID=A0AAQ3Q6V1_9LILI|nr:E3 ubiquitin-protein ligase [Canna indica]